MLVNIDSVKFATTFSGFLALWKNNKRLPKPLAHCEGCDWLAD